MTHDNIIEQWSDTETNYTCIIKITPYGTYNGYVGVPINPNSSKNKNKKYIKKLQSIYVHGGVTFSGYFENFKDFYFIGFDTLHNGDYIPKPEFLKSLNHDSSTFKDLPFIKNEIDKMLTQLKQI